MSPNVSIAESLEHATKAGGKLKALGVQVYGVNILASQDCVSFCSTAGRNLIFLASAQALGRQCRLIDKAWALVAFNRPEVTMKGSKLPLSLYVYDVVGSV